MAGNTVLNSTYGITYNFDSSTNKATINIQGKPANSIIYFNSDMSNFANNCQSLPLNLNELSTLSNFIKISFNNITNMYSAFTTAII